MISIRFALATLQLLILSPLPPSLSCLVKDSLDQDHSVEALLVESIDHALTPKDKGLGQGLDKGQGQDKGQETGQSKGNSAGGGGGSNVLPIVVHRGSSSGGSSDNDNDHSSSSISSPSSASSSGNLPLEDSPANQLIIFN